MKYVSIFLLVSSLALAQVKLSNVQFLPDLLGIPEADIHFPLLAPDGQTIVYAHEAELCLFRIAERTTHCYPYPETFRGLGRFSTLVWAPDSSRVVFTESFFDLLYDSDIWQLTVATGDITDLTDDGTARFDFGGDTPDPKLLVDYAPTFSPTGDLYFFRSRPTNGINEVLGSRFSLELFKFTKGEAVRVTSFRPQLPIFSIYQSASISPDGSQMALIVLPPDWQNNEASGVWLQSLTTGQREQLLKLSDMPETRPGLEAGAFPPFLPTRLSWAGEGLIIETEDMIGATTMKRNTFYVELATKTVTPLETLASFTSEEVYKETAEPSAFNRVPTSGVILPDQTKYVYVGSSLLNHDYFIWSRSLPPTTKAPIRLGSLPHNQEGATDLFAWNFATPATISSDGKRAQILGYLLTLE
jgi:hypothetical protein